MLIDLVGITRRQAVKVRGVLHVGAHLAEERSDYDAVRAGQVWWVEGNPNLIPKLTQTLTTRDPKRRQGRRATQSHVIHSLVGGQSKSNVTLHVANNGQSSSVLDLGTHKLAHPTVRYVGDVKAPMTTIDRLVDQHKIKANFLNLDIQGYEMEALFGAQGFLDRQAEILYIEVNQDELYVGCTLLPEMTDWLAARGFQLRELCMARDTGWGDACWVKGSR